MKGLCPECSTMHKATDSCPSQPITAAPTLEEWFVRDHLNAHGDIEVVLGNDFKIYIPLRASDWDDAKRSRMRNHARLIAAAPATAAERDRLVVVNEGLVKALEFFFQAIDEEWLVRNIEKDADSDWAIKSMPWVQEFAKAMNALVASTKPSAGQEPEDAGR